MNTIASVIEQLQLRPGRLFIGGQWVDEGDGRFEQINPHTNQALTSFIEAGERGVNRAVAAARKAFDEGPWPRMRAQDRKRLMQPIVDKLVAATEEIARLQSLDNGIPYTFSLNSRVSAKSAADIFDHFIGWIDKINGQTMPIFSDASNMQYMSFRDPVGVVALSLPYNGPVMTFAMKTAAALASGCTVVLKPSELTNLASTRMARVLAESDLPPGVFNFVTGAGQTGAALAGHPDVDKVSFTGSVGVGQKIMVAAAPTMKRLTLELGGKSAGIVFPDTRSVKTAAQTLMGLCSTFMSGQICTTPSRAIVHRSVMDEFLHHAAQQLKLVRFGDPFDPATTSAPMISRKHQATVLDFVASGQEQGATLVAGGTIGEGELAHGNWVHPALFANVRNDMRIAAQEIFGPVLSVIPFDTEEEAIRIANDSPFGLAGAVFTTDVSRAFRVSRAIKSGCIGVNGFASIPNAPFGGIKLSGTGREGGWASIEAFTELKTINFNLDA